MKKLLLFITLVLLTVSLFGCSKSSGKGQGGLKDEKVENYSVKIVYDGKQVRSYTIDDIKKMPVISFELNGSKEEGPDVSYILKQNNITEYSKIKFIGMGKDSFTMKVRSGSVELYCKDCGARLMIPASTDADLDDLCCQMELKIKRA